MQSNLELGTPTSTTSASAVLARGSKSVSPAQSASDANETRAYLEQVRLTILGMEQRMQAREDKLAKHIERAETEGARFEEVRRQALATSGH